MSNGPKEVISPFVLRALACDMEEMQSPQAWADRCRAAAAEIEKLRAQNERLATSNHAYLSNYQEAADEIEKLREVLRHTVMLFEEILEAIDADPVETMLVLRKGGVEVERITASQCFNKARTLLGEKE